MGVSAGTPDKTLHRNADGTAPSTPHRGAQAPGQLGCPQLPTHPQPGTTHHYTHRAVSQTWPHHFDRTAATSYRLPEHFSSEPPYGFYSNLTKPSSFCQSTALLPELPLSAILSLLHAVVVELVDTRDLKSLEGNLARVRVPPTAPAYAKASAGEQKKHMDIPRPKSSQPLPAHAKKVFSGAIFDVYQWEQKMYDGSTTIFEKLKRPDTVIVFAITDDGKILLTKQEQPGKAPFIGAAGGRVDAGEDILTAAKRELLEETGYSAKEYILLDAQQPISKIEWAVYTFIAKGITNVAELNLDAGEKISLYPVSFEELLKIGTEPQFYEKEIQRYFWEAQVDTEKKESLKNLFST